MNFRNMVLLYGSFVLVFLAPLVFWNHGLFPHISSKTFFLFGAVEVLFFVWLYTILVDRSYRLSRNVLWCFAPLILFVVWMTLSGVFSANPGLSFWSSLGRGTGLLTLYHCFALSVVVASLVKKGGMAYVRSLFGWFVAGASVLALSVWVGSEGFGWSSRVLLMDSGGGFSGNSTIAATYLLFALSFIFFLLSTKTARTRKKRLLWASAGIMLLSPVFLSLYRFVTEGSILGSARGTIVALVSGFAAAGVGYMYLSKKKAVRGISIGLLLAGVGVFSLVWMQLVTPGTAINQRFEQEARGSRFIFWDIAETGMNKKPFFGYGPENYFLAFQENFKPEILLEKNSFEGWADRAHNIYYDLGVSGGYPAVMFYAVFLLSLLYALYALHKKGILTQTQAAIFMGLLGAYVVNNLLTFDSNLSLMALFVLAGVLYALNDERASAKQESSLLERPEVKIAVASGIGIALIASLTFFVFMPVAKSKLYAETFSAPINRRPLMYEELLRGSAAGEHWDASGLAFETYKRYAANPAQIKGDTKNLSYFVDNIEGLLEYMYAIEENNEQNYRFYITLVFLENTLTYLTDRPHDEESVNRVWNDLERAQALSPTNPNVYWSIAQLRAWEGDLEGVEKAYRDAVALDPLLPSSHRLLINFARAVGNQELYREALTEAEKTISGFTL